MKKRTRFILLATLILSLAACEKQSEPVPEADNPSAQTAPVEAPTPEAPAEEEPEPEKKWTQADIRRMYQEIRQPEWEFIDCLVTPDTANDCVGAALYWDGETSTLVRFFDETGYSYCAGPVARSAEDAAFTYLGDGAVAFRLQKDDGTVYDYTLTLTRGGTGAFWTAKDSLTAPEANGAVS